MTGSGCNNNQVVLTQSDNGPPVYMFGKNVLQSHRMTEMDMPVNVTQITSHYTTLSEDALIITQNATSNLENVSGFNITIGNNIINLAKKRGYNFTDTNTDIGFFNYAANVWSGGDNEAVTLERVRGIEIYTPMAFDNDGLWGMDAMSGGSARIINVRRTDGGYVDYNFTTNMFTQYFIYRDALFNNSACGNSSVDDAIDIKFDYIENVFVIVTLSNNVLCFAVSSSAIPVSTTWSIHTFVLPSTLTLGFNMGIWNNYYTVCWSGTCAITLKTFVGGVATFATATGPVNAINQHDSVSGPFITTYSPCGAFAYLDPVAQTMEWMLCTNVNFITNTTTLSLSTTAVTGGWNTSLADPEFNFGNYMRVAYHRFGSYEKVAYTFLSGLTQSKTFVLWAELDPLSTVLMSLPTQPFYLDLTQYMYAPYTAGNFAGASNINYDCHENLYLGVTSKFNLTVLINPTTQYVAQAHLYMRHKTDTLGVMRLSSSGYGIQATVPLQPAFQNFRLWDVTMPAFEPMKNQNFYNFFFGGRTGFVDLYALSAFYFANEDLHVANIMANRTFTYNITASDTCTSQTCTANFTMYHLPCGAPIQTPSNFALTCPPSLAIPSNFTDFQSIFDQTVITGNGCNNYQVQLSAGNNGPPLIMLGKRVLQSHRMTEMDVSVNVTQNVMVASTSSEDIVVQAEFGENMTEVMLSSANVSAEIINSISYKKRGFNFTQANPFTYLLALFPTLDISFGYTLGMSGFTFGNWFGGDTTTLGTAVRGPEIYTPNAIDGVGSWSIDALSGGIDRLIRIRDHRTGNIDFNSTTMMASENYIFRSVLFNNSACVNISADDAIDIKFDYITNKFVIATLSNDNLCFAVSSSATPLTTTWTIHAFVVPSVLTYGFNLGIWNTYYTVCWSGTCAISQKTFAGGIATFATVTGPVHALDQHESLPGVFITTHSPCGAFVYIDPVAQAMKWMLCTSVNFITNTTTFSMSTMNVTGGWNTTIGVPTFNFGAHVRAAYRNYGSFEKVAYTFISGLTEPQTFVLWRDMEPLSTILTSMPTQPFYLNLSQSVQNIQNNLQAAANVNMDCHENLYIAVNSKFNLTTPPTTSTQLIGYMLMYGRYRTDPPGTMRAPGGGSLGMQYPIHPAHVGMRAWETSMPSCQPLKSNLQVSIPFNGTRIDAYAMSAFFLGRLDIHGRSIFSNQTFEYNMTATDSCTSTSCTANFTVYDIPCDVLEPTPSNFALMCPTQMIIPSNFTNFTSIFDQAVVTGTGCNNYQVVLSQSDNGPPVISLGKKSILQASRMMEMEMEVNVTQNTTFSYIVPNENLISSTLPQSNSTPNTLPAQIFENFTAFLFGPEEETRKRSFNFTQATSGLYSFFFGQFYAGGISSGDITTPSLGIEVYTPMAHETTGRWSIDGSSGNLDRVVNIRTHENGFVDFNITSMTFNENFLHLDTLFNNSACGNGLTDYAMDIKFDYSTRVFIIVTLSNNVLCFAVSATDTPFTTSWTIHTFVVPSTITYGFNMGIWNNYYTICWSGTCAITLKNFTGGVVTFATVAGPVHALNQHESIAGTFVTIHSPCGAFMYLDPVALAIKWMLCSSVNFLTNMTTFSMSTMNVTDGWNTTIGVSTFNFGSHIRASYRDFGTYERIAYAFMSGLTMQTPFIYWSELDPYDSILVSSPTRPYRYNATQAVVAGASNIPGQLNAATNLMYDCHESLIFGLNSKYNTTFVTNVGGYTMFARHKEDPAGTVRLSTGGGYSISLPIQPSYYTKRIWDASMPSVEQVKSQRRHAYNFTSSTYYYATTEDHYALSIFPGLRGVDAITVAFINRTFTYNITASDTCTSQTCNANFTMYHAPCNAGG